MYLLERTTPSRLLVSISSTEKLKERKFPMHNVDEIVSRPAEKEHRRSRRERSRRETMLAAGGLKTQE
jgi:hypothetical protein